MSLTPAWLDELRSRTLLSALIGKTIKITKAGREFKGCCPFHNEKTPSFYVNDEKGFYHCFGCSAHGDAIRWMTDQRGLGFMDAVKELADAAGMDVPAPDPRAAEKAEKANSLYDVMTAAADWFREQLDGLEGGDARDYLRRRGLSAATITAFGLGFAPDSRGKLKAALSRFGDAMMVEAGLLIDVEGKEPYDRFRGRLMIPIRDPRGRVIAFGGRILSSGEPKYLNSPDTPLFDKGRTLYNLDKAGPESRKTGRVIVVEGYMDVIALAQAGIGDTVAPLGTALTEHQLERLWRMTESPLLCFDGDSAGQKASVRAIGRALPALAPARSLGFITLPVGQDPDDLIKSGGRMAMDALLKEPEPLVERLWRHEVGVAPLATPEERAGLKQRLMDQAKTIDSPDVREQYISEFLRRYAALFPARPARAPWQPGAPRFQGKGGQGKGGRFQQKGYEAPPMGITRSISGGGVEPQIARAILAGLMRHPAVLADQAESLASLTMPSEELDALRHVLLDAVYARETLDSDALMPICTSAGLGALVNELANANMLAFSFTKSQADSAIARRDLGMAIEALAARPELDAALAAATVRLAEHFDEMGFAEQTRLLEARRKADQQLAALVQGDNDV